MPSLLAPSVHVPCDEQVVAPPSHFTEQSLDANPESHVQVPFPDTPSEHEPWLEHGDAEPPAHSTEQSLVA